MVSQTVAYISTELKTTSEQLGHLSDIFSNYSSHLTTIAQSVHSLSADKWTMYGTFVNIFLLCVNVLVLIAAVYAANKDFFNNLFFKPELSIVSTLVLKQKESWIARVRVTNKNRVMAKNVSLWVDELWNFNAAPQKNTNFLEFPLRWTHSNKECNDLLFNRPYTIDVCEAFDNFRTEVHITSSQGYPSVFGLDDLGYGKNIVRLTTYCDNAPVVSHWLEICFINNKLELKIVDPPDECI